MAQIPRIGMQANIRKRRATVAAAEPHDAGAEGRFHMAHLAYTDTEGGPPEDTVLGEHERNAVVTPGTSVPFAEGCRMAHAKP